jgi:predicted Zn-dependent protease
MLGVFLRTGFVLTALCLAAPAHAGMKSDLANCPGGLGSKSAKACTRILKSGRLPKKQFYIAYYNRGWAYRNAGDYKRAQRDFDRVVKLNRNFAEGYYSRAVVRYDRGKKSEAIKDLDQYVKYKKKKKWSAYYGRALMLRRLNQRRRALSDLRAAEKLEPSEHKIVVMRALVLSDQGKHKEALKTIDPVIDAHPKDADALHARAVIQFRRKRFIDAEADLDDAMRLRKSFEAAYLLRGQILEQRGKNERARTQYERALATSAKTVEQLYAQKTARARLRVLNGRKSSPVIVSSSGSDCRRFVPAANMTIAIDCKE